jgi:hypothetical protein
MFDPLADFLLLTLTLVAVATLGPHANHFIYGEKPPPHIARLNLLYVEVFAAVAGAVVGTLRFFWRDNPPIKLPPSDTKQLPKQ